MRHISGLRRHQLNETVETVYTAPGGDRIAIIDTTADLELIGFDTCVMPSGMFTLHVVQRGDDTFWIALDDQKQGTLAHVRTRTENDVTTAYYRPGDSPAVFLGGYDSADDLRAALGDPEILGIRVAEYEERTAAAQAARNKAIGDGHSAWSHQVYAAACHAAGVPVLTEEEVMAAEPELRNTEHWLREYSVAEVLTVQMAVWRILALRNDRAEADAAALRAADDAAGPGPYDRDEYEAACRAAEVIALPDTHVVLMTDAALNAPVRMYTNLIAYALPGHGAANVALAMRRLGGMSADERDAARAQDGDGEKFGRAVVQAARQERAHENGHDGAQDGGR